MRAQYKINKIESKSNKNKESSNARADDNFRKSFTSDRPNDMDSVLFPQYNSAGGLGTKKQERHVTSRIGSFPYFYPSKLIIIYFTILSFL